MSDKTAKDEIRQTLSELGVEIDDSTLDRLSEIHARGGSPAEMMGAVFDAFGMPGMDRSALEALVDAAERTESPEEFADAVLIGPCPSCGFEQTRNAEQDPDIQDLTVGVCPKCGHLWCSECGTPLTRAAPECQNPDCFLNQPDPDEARSHQSRVESRESRVDS